MRTSTSRLPDLAEVEDYVAEGTHLLRAGAERLDCLRRDGACEAEQRWAADILAAMERIQVLLQDHHSRLARADAVQPVTRPAPGSRRWWPVADHRSEGVARSR
ncbi:hypothetical protein [Methylobacterium nigriterrae]|uniref:hypothetical protein n=1 Tax=Methylobacterium nigriterrae TaxID=3127512 RepID=UPI003013D7BC